MTKRKKRLEGKINGFLKYNMSLIFIILIESGLFPALVVRFNLNHQTKIEI